MQGKNDNISDNFGPYKDKESTSKTQDIEKNHRDLINKSSDDENYVRAGHTPEDGLLKSELSSFIREVRFSEQKFPTNIPVSNIKYDHLKSQNNNLFYPFHNQLDYTLAHYFAEFKAMKSNINKFLFDPLMAPFTKKLSY